jgi:UDP-N-acetylmuramyl pentapeptide synthase
MKSFAKSLIIRILTWEAALLLRRHKPTIVAVTGSVGKTATKDAIYEVLRSTQQVRKSEKSFNSEVGIPLTVLGLPNAWNNPFGWLRNLIVGCTIAFFSRSYPRVLVLEAGVDTPGDMNRLTEWMTPDYVVVTRLPDVPVHVEHFASPEEVVQEKMSLVNALEETGTFIYNADDHVLQSQANQIHQRQVSYARYANASYLISDDTTVYGNDGRPVGFSYQLQTPLDSTYMLYGTGTIGMQLAYVYTVAAVIGEEFGVPPEDIEQQLAEYTPPPGRMRIIPGIKDSLLLDDTYNSSPVATESALQTIHELTYGERKIAVLGDMLELGRFSVEQHERIGTLTASTVDVLFAVGIRARAMAQAALVAGLPEDCIYQYDDADRAGKELQNWLRSGDVVLVKGSQSMRMERIVEEVMQHPEHAPKLLVRQDHIWKKR